MDKKSETANCATVVRKRFWRLQLLENISTKHGKKKNCNLEHQQLLRFSLNSYFLFVCFEAVQHVHKKITCTVNLINKQKKANASFFLDVNVFANKHRFLVQF